MRLAKPSGILVENTIIESEFLARDVKTDLYFPRFVKNASFFHLLLINDGQDLPVMDFEAILDRAYQEDPGMAPLLCVGLHCSKDRRMEYGVAGVPDYLGRGAKAGLYTSFVLKELLPFLHRHFGVGGFREQAFAGFSLGGLMALDLVWKHPQQFTKAGVFSGSLWWRSVDQDRPEYEDDKHRIMQQEVRKGSYAPGLRFFFQCGTMDESRDRNQNGIIDSIDDTLDLVKELVGKGYDREKDIHYLEMPDGRHDVPTWGRAFPEFLNWAWGRGG